MKLKAPENAGTHVSFDGKMYEIKDGLVDVPEHATELLQHGFAPAPAKAEKAPAKAKDADKQD